MANITTEFCGISFANPIIIPAGVHGRSGKVIREIGESGVAGICTKTIVSQSAPDVLPCFVKVKSGMLNSVFGSDRQAEYWFTEGLKEAKKGKAKLIANLAGFTPDEAASLAVKACDCGADIIEIPTHCPHMGEILLAMFPGMPYQEPKLTDFTPMQETVRKVKEKVSVPVVVKLSGTFSHITREWARAVKEAGADGIACSDALGPGLAVDIATGEPLLGGPRGVGGLTGPAILPITLRMVLEIAMEIDLPIVGVGGVSSAEDVLQYIMAGATLVGVCTAGHLSGPLKYSSIIKDLSKIMDKHGFSSLEEIKGLTLKRLKEREKNGKLAWTKPIVPLVDEKLCTACGICEKVCAYEAITIPKKAVVEGSKCIGCGLCVTSCPVNAFTQKYY